MSIIHTNPETQSAAVKLRGFWNEREAERASPVTSRPDLVAERNGEPVTVEHVTLSGDEHTSETETRPTDGAKRVRAAVRHPVSNAWVIVTLGESGYSELGPRDHSPPFDGDAFNDERGITSERANAMLAGSMFGWDCPAAQPAFETD